VTETTTSATGGSEATEGAFAAGAALRQAREAAGLSIDSIAHQLKLHPRQVQALEDGTHDQLPGRTFVRGFMRNYARALNLDPAQVLAMLPDEAPEALGSTTHSMGEIRFESAPRRTWSRWAIPLALVALVALAAVYEFTRPQGEPRTAETRTPPATASDAPAPSPAPPPPTAESAGTPLPNPLSGPGGDAARTADAPPGSAGTPAGTPAPAPAPGFGGTTAPGGTGIVSTAIPPGTLGEPTLVIVFGGRSWAEVRDAKGRVLLSLTGSPGMTQSVSGTPPYDVVIGSVADVSLQFRGAAVDLAPYRRANVARLRLE